MLPYQCATCVHFKEDRLCSAFPDNNIPLAIITNEFDHSNPWPDAEDPKDRGIRYKAFDIVEK